MKTGLLILLAFFLFMFQGCRNDNETLPSGKNDYVFNENYFYYTFDWEKIRIYLNIPEIFVAFDKDSVSEAEANSVLDKYFNPPDSFYIKSHTYNRFRLKFINDDTVFLKKMIRRLNTDSLIYYATPVFSFNPSPVIDPWGCEDVLILSDEIVFEPIVPESEYKREISRFDLSIIKYTSTYILLKVNNIENGFESLAISDFLYESQKFKYCDPNFYTTICLN